jgi:hypothetical protein
MTDTRPLIALHVAGPEFVTLENKFGWFPSLLAPGKTQPTAEQYKPFADQLIAFAKTIDAQGVVIWNGEGAGRQAAIGYEGTPANHGAWVKYLSKRLRDAGLKVGCTLRHTIIGADGKVPCWVEPWDVVGTLIRKADDAKARGCGDYVYIDSNSDWWGNPIDVRIIAAVHNARPDVLLIPEHATPDYPAYSMPYRESTEPRAGKPGGEVIALKFGDDYAAKVSAEVLAQLREDRAAGSLFLVRWYDSPESRVLEQLK